MGCTACAAHACESPTRGKPRTINRQRACPLQTRASHVIIGNNGRYSNKNANVRKI